MPSKHKNTVKLGAEAFLEGYLDLVKSKKVGLITNPSGIDRRRRSLIDLFAQNPKIHLVAIYGPEHGIRGNAQAGEFVPYCQHDKYDIPVFSLYGQSQKLKPGILENLDEHMRAFDTVKSAKVLEQDMLQGIDVMVYDIQDVGTRIYTYTATMAYCMEACAQNGIAFIVLDRPNPINGIDMEGPILEYPQYSSFVGLYPVPVRHGMTSGELALLFNENYLEEKADLTVIPMEGWERDMWFDQTSIPWVPPSPNMPSLETATVYPGQVFLEGTNISEGRGTDHPFELFGAPWIKGCELTKELNALHLPGIFFKEEQFTPEFSKFRSELCGGVRILIQARQEYKPFATALFILKTTAKNYAEHFVFYDDYFDQIIGNSKVRDKLVDDLSIPEILKTYDSQIEQFDETRKPFLLY